MKSTIREATHNYVRLVQFTGDFHPPQLFLSCMDWKCSRLLLSRWLFHISKVRRWPSATCMLLEVISVWENMSCTSEWHLSLIIFHNEVNIFHCFELFTTWLDSSERRYKFILMTLSTNVSNVRLTSFHRLTCFSFIPSPSYLMLPSKVQQTSSFFTLHLSLDWAATRPQGRPVCIVW